MPSVSHGKEQTERKKRKKKERDVNGRGMEERGKKSNTHHHIKVRFKHKKKKKKDIFGKTGSFVDKEIKHGKTKHNSQHDTKVNSGL